MLFLIDEVSQYIGDNSSCLNLQTIVEEIGASCNNKVWMATTAQQTLEQLVGSNEIDRDQFGKILGVLIQKYLFRAKMLPTLLKKNFREKFKWDK